MIHTSKNLLARSPRQCGSKIARRFINSSLLTIDRKTDRTDLENSPDKEELLFGQTMSDHMLVVEWDEKNHWSAPRIIPYGDLNLSPAAASLHYGLQCFEGMKAYKSLTDDSLRLFRPDKNAERLSNSMDRLSMPGADFDREELVKCIAELVRVDQEWIPSGEGYSLYIRPTVVATNRNLGLAAPTSILLYAITSPVGPYYKSGFAPIKLTADTPYVRAWPGGTGNSKVGGNYAPTLKPQAEANRNGYSQVLWLFGEDDQVTEVGSMNLFFFLINKETQRPELITAPLDRADVLPGVTRDSILALARSWEEFDVSERSPTMMEIQEAAEDGRLLEAFGAGTAAVVSPISAIQYKGKDIQVPTGGELTQRFWDRITGIQYGKEEGPEGWSVKI